MRILYVLGFLPTYVKTEIDTLVSLGHEVFVLLPADTSTHNTSSLWTSIVRNKNSRSCRYEYSLRFDLLTCSSSKLVQQAGSPFKHPFELVRSLSEREFRYYIISCLASNSLHFRPDIIHSHFAGDAAHIAYFLSRTLRVPYTVTTHARDIFVPQNRGRLTRILRRAAAVITISEYNRTFLLRTGLLKQNAVVCRLGVPLDAFPARPGSVELTHGVCVASGLVQKKGVDVLLEALMLLKDRFPDLHLTVVGSDPEGTRLSFLQTHSAELPVRFEGMLTSEETLKLVSSAGFFVLPSMEASDGDMDGIPVALMEAMAMGVPSVSTRISGIPELIDHEVSGLLAEPGSAGDLAKCISFLLLSEQASEELGGKGRIKVESNHNPKKQGKLLEEILRKVIDNDL